MANFEKDKLIQIPRPELGRPTDPRLTPEYIAARPELERAGYPAFDPTRDIDYHGYIEGALQWLQSLASYATPEVAAQVKTTLAEAQKALADTAQQQERNNADTAANLGRLSAPSVADIPGVAGVYNILGGAEAGQVWRRNPDMGLERLEWAEAAPNSAVLALQMPDMAAALASTSTAPRQIVGGWHGGGEVFDLLPPGDGAVVDGGTVLLRQDGRKLRRSRKRLYTPEDFGAAGDGVTDDTDALMRLLRCGKAIDLGSLTYRVSKLWVRDLTSLRITSNGAVIIGDDRTTDAESADDYSSVLNLVYCRGIRGEGTLTVRMVSDWTPTRNDSPGRTKGVASIKLAYCEDFHIGRGWEGQHSTAFGWLLESSRNGELHRPRVFSTLADGIHVANDSYDVDIYDPATDLTGDDGVSVIRYDQTPGRQTRRVNVYRAQVRRSFARGLTAGGSADVLFEGGRVEKTADSGLKTFNDTHAGTGAPERVTYRNIEVVDAGSFGVPIGPGHGVDIGDGTYGDNIALDCVVDNCTVRGNTRGRPFAIYGTRTRLLGKNKATGGKVPSIVSIFGDSAEVNLEVTEGADDGLWVADTKGVRGTITSERNAGAGVKLHKTSSGALTINARRNGKMGLVYTGCSNFRADGVMDANAQAGPEAHIVGTNDAGPNANVQTSGMEFIKGDGKANLTVYVQAGSTNCNVTNCGLVGGAEVEAPLLNGSGVSANNY